MKKRECKSKNEKKKTKKLFFAFLDAITLLSFSLAVYFTLIQDYMRTILCMSLGTLLLMFFIVMGILKVHSKEYKL
jgi:Ca2+/Na+ antiporter